MRLSQWTADDRYRQQGCLQSAFLPLDVTKSQILLKNLPLYSHQIKHEKREDLCFIHMLRCNLKHVHVKDFSWLKAVRLSGDIMQRKISWYFHRYIFQAVEKSERMKLSVEELTSEKKTLETQVSLSLKMFIGTVEKNKSASAESFSCNAKIILTTSAWNEKSPPFTSFACSAFQNVCAEDAPLWCHKRRWHHSNFIDNRPSLMHRFINI